MQARDRLLARILQLRNSIRYHRDQVGDDRCWLDDYLMYRLLSDTYPEPRYSRKEGMDRCREFYKLRNASRQDPTPREAIRDRKHWDDDLVSMSQEKLIRERWRIEQAIRVHRSVFQKTKKSDRALYAMLPEKLPADFSLPPENEFLGRAKPGAGCPNFWRSHAGCIKPCNMHQWGPCSVPNPAR